MVTVIRGPAVATKTSRPTRPLQCRPPPAQAPRTPARRNPPKAPPLALLLSSWMRVLMREQTPDPTLATSWLARAALTL